jgi:excisionase family DNA binding protein
MAMIEKGRAKRMPDDKFDLLTLEEVAEVLRCSVQTVRRAIADGRLHARKVPGGWRVPRGALKRMLEKEVKDEC